MNKLLLTDSELKDIVLRYGSPLYLFYENEFRANFAHLCEVFRAVYKNYIPAYSYKTNYTPYVCGIVKEMGGYAEVVSDMELYLAKKIGYNHSQIFYNGPCKGKMLEEHLLAGGISNIDNEDEAKRIVMLAQQHSKAHIRVGIRVNSDIGAGYVSRFGIEMDSEAMKRTFTVLKNCRNISVCGLHCHISRARGIVAWQKRIDNLLHVADTYLEKVPDFIDVGSGMFGEMDSSLSAQFEAAPSYEDYAKVVAGTMAKHYEQATKKPILFSEPGTTLIAKYLSLVTTVDNIKTIKDSCFVTVDSSYYNTGEIVLMKKLPYRIVRNGKGDTRSIVKKTNIMGFTCLEQDCIYTDFPESVQEGDIIEFGNVGGYSIVSKPPFIQPNCKILSITPEGDLVEIKRQETYEDIFQTFNLNL